MAYTKTVWVTGDVITATKLNNAEDGIEAAQLPDIADADVNDYLSVVSITDYSEIVPEQTITITDAAVELDDIENADLWVSGATVIITVDDESSEATIGEETIGLAANVDMSGTYLIIYLADEKFYAITDSHGVVPFSGKVSAKKASGSHKGVAWVSGGGN